MTASIFDAMADASASYFHAIRMCRLRGILTGEFWPHEEDEFDLHMAAVLMRGQE